jgi:iron complex outermembrane receptor protein
LGSRADRFGKGALRRLAIPANVLAHGFTGSVLLTISAQPAVAQTAPDILGPETIIVTAQRRPERPEDVPIFLTALSGEDLDRKQATDMASLGKVVPSLVMTRSGAFTQPFLRGVGKRSTLGVENSVATYLDGVYLASSISALLDLRGVERVEVLNGPQGTLFGRNTTGGVIQVVTRNPTPDASGETELSAGSYGYVRADVYATGGNDRVAGNLAVSLSRNGGYGTNVFTGKKDQGRVDHSIVGRSKWVWQLSEPVKVTLAGDYQNIDQDFTQLPVKGFEPVGEPRVVGFRSSDQNGLNRYRFRYGGASARADAEIGNLLFTGLSAARWMHARYGTDLDLGPVLLLEGVPSAKQRQLSQEFQLRSGDSSRIRWIAGLYYIHIDEEYDPTAFLYGGSYSARLGGRLRQDLFDTGDVDSYAAYGQATWPIGRRTEVTTGLRYTIEHRTVRARGQQLFDNAPFVRPIPGLPLLDADPLRSSDTFREPTWRVSLDRHFSSALMAYVSMSRGFQSGGWNLQTPQNPAFDPERLDAFEGGVKYADRSGRFSANASAFYYDYSQLQVSAFTPLGSMTTNATSAYVHGLDVQLDARPNAATGLTVAAQFLHARFGRFPNATCTDYSANAVAPFPPISCDASGNRLPFAPRFKLNAGADHDFSFGSFGSLGLTGNLAYNSGYFSEADNVVRQKAFVTLDASVEWKPPGRGPSVRLWARNLTDAHYFDSLATFPTTGVLQRPAAPHQFGVSVSSTF